MSLISSIWRIIRDIMSAPAPPTPPDTIYVNYFDSIDEAKTKALMAICSDIVAKQKPRTIYFLFSSNGGAVNAGITFYNFLRALPVEIVMHNVRPCLRRLSPLPDYPIHQFPQ